MELGFYPRLSGSQVMLFIARPWEFGCDERDVGKLTEHPQ